MAAKNHLQGEQLRMFMRPQEVMDFVKDSVDRPSRETMEDLWREKDEELDYGYRHLYKTVRQQSGGVHRPITIIPPNYSSDDVYTMGQGHHRVVASLRAEKRTGKERYIPVVYDSDFNYSQGPMFSARRPK